MCMYMHEYTYWYTHPHVCAVTFSPLLSLHVWHVWFVRVTLLIRESCHTNMPFDIYLYDDSTHGGDRIQTHYDRQDTQQVFTLLSTHIKHVFTGVPKIPNDFSVEYRESLSLKRSIGGTDRSRDPNFWSLISSVSRVTHDSSLLSSWVVSYV